VNFLLISVFGKVRFPVNFLTPPVGYATFELT